MLIEAVVNRLQELTDYSGLVEQAAQFNAVFLEPSKLQGPLKAFVIPLGGSAKPAVHATGVHHQPTERLIGVGLALRSAGDVSGSKLSIEIEQREADIIDHLAGWQPDGFKFCMAYRSSRFLDMRDGVAFQEMQFSIQHFIRKVLT